MELVELIEPAAGPRPVSISPPDVADAAKAPEPMSDGPENKENAPKMRKLSGYVHYSNSTRAGATPRPRIVRDEASAKSRRLSVVRPSTARARRSFERSRRADESSERARLTPSIDLHYARRGNRVPAGVKAEIDADEANAALTAQEKNQKVMQVLGARWKGLDDGAKATWAADAPEYEVKPKKPKKAKLPALTDAERDTAREMLMGIVAEKLKERDSLEGAFDGPAAPVANKPAAPEPAAPMEVVMKKLSGKEFYNKESRAEAKAAVERDHADAGGKEKQALIQKALGAGWKALDDGAKAKWAADAPEVEVKKKRPREEPAPPAPAPPSPPVAPEVEEWKAAEPDADLVGVMAALVTAVEETAAREELIESFLDRITDDVALVLPGRGAAPASVAATRGPAPARGAVPATVASVGEDCDVDAPLALADEPAYFWYHGGAPPRAHAEMRKTPAAPRAPAAAPP